MSKNYKIFLFSPILLGCGGPTAQNKKTLSDKEIDDEIHNLLVEMYNNKENGLICEPFIKKVNEIKATNVLADESIKKFFEKLNDSFLLIRLCVDENKNQLTVKINWQLRKNKISNLTNIKAHFNEEWSHNSSDYDLLCNIEKGDLKIPQGMKEALDYLDSMKVKNWRINFSDEKRQSIYIDKDDGCFRLIENEDNNLPENLAIALAKFLNEQKGILFTGFEKAEVVDGDDGNKKVKIILTK